MFSGIAPSARIPIGRRTGKTEPGSIRQRGPFMPVQVSYPGVYIEEISSGVHTIIGVATSITAFIGRALRGPTDIATTINSYADFERSFGGLWLGSRIGK